MTGWLVAATLAAAASSIVPLASLQVTGNGPAMIVQIRDGAAGRTLAIDCVDRCPGPPHFSEPFDDTPLGLFQPLDSEPLVVAVAAGGSTYHVRAYRLLATRVTRVLDVATRAAPGIAVAGDGAIVVTTTERAAGSAARDQAVTWAWRGARFTRR